MKNKIIAETAGIIKLNPHSVINEQEAVTTTRELKINEPKNLLKDYDTGAAVSKIFYFKK